MPERGLFIANAMHTPTKRLGLNAMTVPANVARFLFEISNENEPIHVVRFDMQESLSTLYAVNLTVAVENGSVKPSDWLGKSGCITLADNVTPRVFHGEIVAVKQSDPGRRLTQYLVTLAPRFWYLQHRSGCRIFQEKSVPDIISQVFSEANITNSDYRFELQKTYSPREFCVQYQESEFHFLSRLMEEEGLFYFFEHTASKHVMVICDANKSFKPQASDHRIPYHPKTSMRPDRSIIYQVSSRRQVVVNSVTVKDFNFEKTHLTLDVEVTKPNPDKLEHYVYPGGFKSPGKGKQYASSMNDASLVRRETISGKTDDIWMSVGRTFDLVEHANDKFNAKYLVIGANYLGEQPQSLEEGAANSGSSYHTKFNAIPASVTYKAEIVHKKKTIDGAQSAFVTGPPGEEIYTDEYGRVKVQFHWDREGQYNENASCWVRVNQGWAGNEWGSVTLPRVGQEVLVSFVDGDPDRPLVVGGLYNSVNKKPISLPSNKSRTTFKSHSYPGGGGYNELTIEDKKGSEKLNIHAQKDMDLYVQNDLKEIVENDQHDTVSKSLSAEIGKNLNQSIGKSANHKIGKTLSNTIGKDANIKVSGSLMEQAGKDIHVKAGTKIVLQSGTQLTLKGGAGFIVLNPAGVVIKGPMVKINSGGSAGSAGGPSPEAPEVPDIPEKSKTGKAIKIKPAESAHQQGGIQFGSGSGKKLKLESPSENSGSSSKVNSIPASKLDLESEATGKEPSVAERQVLESISIKCVDADGLPAEGAHYIVRLKDGSTRGGRLDKNGQIEVVNLPAGKVEVTLGEPVDEMEIQHTREKIQSALNNIVDKEKQDAAKIEADLKQKGVVGQYLEYELAKVRGGAKAIWGIVTGLKELSDLVNPNVHLSNAIQSAWAAWKHSDDKPFLDCFNQNYSDAQFNELADVIGFDPRSITKEQLAEAQALANFVWDDAETQDMLLSFAGDYIAAQHSLEITEGAAGAVTEVAIDILLTSLTLGAGAAFVLSSKVRHLAKFKQLGLLIKKLAKKIKQKKAWRTESGSTGDTFEFELDKPENRPVEGARIAGNSLYAKNLREAVSRLEDAKNAILKARENGEPLPQSPFSLEDKQEIVRRGLEENILIRVIKTDFAKHDGKIGRVTNGQQVFFTAPFSQVEHGDTQAKELMNAFGTHYDPSSKYTMLVMDRSKMEQLGDIQTIIPTFDNLNGMIRDNPGMGIDPDIARRVLNPDFAPKYESFSKSAQSAGVDLNNEQQAAKFAELMGYSKEDISLLRERHKIANDLSAWDIFQGNGMTRDTNYDYPVDGPVEVFIFDRKPLDLGKLKEKHALDMIELD